MNFVFNEEENLNFETILNFRDQRLFHECSWEDKANQNSLFRLPF